METCCIFPLTYLIVHKIKMFCGSVLQPFSKAYEFWLRSQNHLDDFTRSLLVLTKASSKARKIFTQIRERKITERKRQIKFLSDLS